MKRIVLFFVFLLIATTGNSQIRLPYLVSDNMMLQCDVPVKIWGWASPDESISLIFTGKEHKTVSDKNGNWEITLPAQKAAVKADVTIKSSNNNNVVTVKNILFGDVWLCSGQSNMETPVSRLMSKYEDEINSCFNPEIRYIKIPLSYNFHAPQDDIMPCSWTDLTPKSAMDFSGVAYFYARYLYDKTGVPQGIINSSVGGSPAEAWLSDEYIKKFPAFENAKRMCESDGYVADMRKLGSASGQRWGEVAISQDKGLNEAIKWSSNNYDFSNWAVTDLFDNSWGKDGYHPVNGIFWFKKEVELPEGVENEAALLIMGRIVDSDSIYVNGVCVGTTGYQYPPRNYTIPKGTLKHGKNIITVRLASQNGFPEFVKDKPYKIIFVNKEEINLEGNWKFRLGAIMPAVSGGGITLQYQPVGLFNAMISPVKKMAIKGFVWYQGEANTGYYDSYYELMTSLIDNWRVIWGQGKPFLFVQLANFMEPAFVQQYSNWAELRNVQFDLSQTVTNSGMAVAIDIGEWNDIHPLNKKDVGKRLGLQALKYAYNEKILADGPVYKSFTKEGNTIIVSFKEGTDDLKPMNELKGFAIAGDNGIYLPAKAKIEGRKVIVRNDDIANPKSVRYAWANNPEGANLYNTADLPASPFETK